MPASQRISKSIKETILKGKNINDVLSKLESKTPKEKPLPLDVPKKISWTKEAQEERLAILKKQNISLPFVSGKKSLEDVESLKGNIENYIGMAQIPIGVVGPLRINGAYANGDYYIPLATTEGTLVASYNRGAKIISLSGGARAVCLTERISRAPGFAFNNLMESGKFVAWCVQKFPAFKQLIKKTTRHGKLNDMKTTMEGNHVYLDFEYTTGDASGQNLVTIATEAICKYIEKKSPIKPRFWFVESNLSGDKKATVSSYLYTRGKKVVAEVLIPKKILTRFLHTTPEMMLEYWKMSFVGGVQSGSIGVQGHYANGLAALFIACGQDAACVAEASMGITRIDILNSNDLYISVSLPNIIVGTVGGGTRLSTQKECLKMVDCLGDQKARKFAEICAATVLAGEISIMGALAAGEFTQAHINYARNKKVAS